MSSLTNKIISENFTREKALAVLNDKEIEKVRELVICSAFPLSTETTENLCRKARKLFNQELFIDVKVDPGLIGGAALVWKGRYRDYSLKAKFEEKQDILTGIYDQFIQDRRSWLSPEH